MRNIKVAVFPGDVKTVVIENGSTVEGAYKKAGLKVNSTYEYTANSTKVEYQSVIAEGVTLLVATEKIKGN